MPLSVYSIMAGVVEAALIACYAWWLWRRSRRARRANERDRGSG
ncbi:MAG: hypothetical protein AB7G11_16665 [Phycisphaerales bacterium]